MEKRKVSYTRISLILIAIIIAIFGVDFVVRSVQEANHSPIADVSNASQANPASGLESIGSETATTTTPQLTDTATTNNTTDLSTTNTTTASPNAVKQNNYDIDPNLFYTLQYSSNDMKYGSLVLANSTTPYYKDVSGTISYFYDLKNDLYTISTDSIQLMSEPIEQFNAMLSDFNILYGINNISVLSGYSNTSTDKCAIDHSTGYGFDLGIVDSNTTYPLSADGDYNWIFQNAYKYGFIERYPADKESITGVPEQVNHFRYVGVPHSYIMHDNNFSLEEYIDYLKNYTFDKEHITTTVYSYSYEIYFIPSEGETTNVPVPIDKYYVVLGNNVDGFIVVIQTKADKSVIPSEYGAEDTTTDTASNDAYATTTTQTDTNYYTNDDEEQW